MPSRGYSQVFHFPVCPIAFSVDISSFLEPYLLSSSSWSLYSCLWPLLFIRWRPFTQVMQGKLPLCPIVMFKDEGFPQSPSTSAEGRSDNPLKSLYEVPPFSIATVIYSILYRMKKLKSIKSNQMRLVFVWNIEVMRVHPKKNMICQGFRVLQNMAEKNCKIK